MFGLTVVSGVPFVAGLFEGINRRKDRDFRPDPWAAYKLMSLTSGIAFAQIISQYGTPVKSNIKQLATMGLFGGPLIAGTMYCMGIQLAKIPQKDAF